LDYQIGEVSRALIIPVLLVCLGPCGHSQASDAHRPNWSKELKGYGWTAPKPESNKAYFRDFSLGKLAATDINSRIVFVKNDVIVAYHTKQEGQDWRTASRCLQAFFINANDGALLTTLEWPSITRGSESDLIDSESRLIPVSDGRFLVLANRTMMLYRDNRELLKKKKLESVESGDLWSVQSVANGDKIFLRHQSAAEQQTDYFWLTSDTLLPFSQMPGPRGPNFSVQATAGDDFVITTVGFSGPGITTGIAKASVDGSTKIICSEQFCREAGGDATSLHTVAVSGRRGFGIVDTEHGLLWSKQIPSGSNANDFQFGRARAAMSAQEFAIWMTSMHPETFDGVRVGKTPTLLVYDASSGRLLFSIPIQRKSGNFDFALSPDGTRLAIFDGANLSLYTISHS
jgi:hypothetical protein